MKHNTSLFRRTALTVAAGLLTFQIVSGTAIFMNVVFPIAQRSADDLAALLIWSGQIWQETALPQRSAFELELRKNYALTIQPVNQPLKEKTISYPYINFLRNSLIKRLPDEQTPRLTEDAHEHFQVEFHLEGQLLRFDFAKALLAPRPSRALAWTISAGILATMVIAWLLAQRITAPVSRLAEAARRIGLGKQPPQLPETGAAELAELSHIFNETARQLQARRDNQTTLLAGVSHDLRSPLARMKMALGLLSEQHTSPLISRMERDIAEMDTLIGAQLELARAQEQESTELTNIHELLADLIDASEARAPGRLYLRSCPVCTFRVAPVTLRRCLDNLINNALLYSGKSRVEVVCRQYRHVLCIAVRDRGPGIPAHLNEVVFRPFYRIESSRNRSTGGSGLGLAITRQLAETQGWRVNIKSRQGGGVTAWILIPETTSFE